MTDRLLTTLLLSGLLIEIAAFVCGFTSIGWRWPMVAAGAIVSGGCILVTAMSTKRLDGPVLAFHVMNGLVLAFAAGHAFSVHPALSWSLRIGVGIQTLALVLMLAFMLFFEMGRLF